MVGYLAMQTMLALFVKIFSYLPPPNSVEVTGILFVLLMALKNDTAVHSFHFS